MRFWLCLTLLITPAHVARVIDGDTFALWDVGIPTQVGVRPLGIDTPERGEPGFFEARDFTVEWLTMGPFTMHTCSKDSFGRYLAVVFRGADTLAVALRNAGFGR